MIGRFDLTGKTAIVTGGSGFLGAYHCEAIRQMGGTAIAVDINPKADAVCDITDPDRVQALSGRVPRCDILINNAAVNDPVMVTDRLEYLPLERFRKALDVGLTGAFIMSSIFGERMHKEGGGVIINIGSDLSLVAPDQRIYKPPAVKAAHYSVVKHGIIGLTRYLATYWPNVRCNALCLGGVGTREWTDEFFDQFKERVPMGRGAMGGEYNESIQFLASSASSYMNGAVLTVDGGRTAW